MCTSVMPNLFNLSVTGEELAPETTKRRYPFFTSQLQSITIPDAHPAGLQTIFHYQYGSVGQYSIHIKDEGGDFSKVIHCIWVEMFSSLSFIV